MHGLEGDEMELVKRNYLAQIEWETVCDELVMLADWAREKHVTVK